MPLTGRLGLRWGFLRALFNRTRPAPVLRPAPTAEERVPDLDGLRGVAVLLVILFHMAGQVGLFAPMGYTIGRADRWPLLALYAGWAGVDLFFVLSGFLITGILLRAKGRPGYYKHFYLRRAVRIMPLYYAVLLALVALSKTDILWLAVNPTECLSHAVFLGNFWGCVAPTLGQPQTTGGIQVYWSFAIEEQFYLVWPFVVAASSRAWLGRICAAGVVAAVGCRWGLTSILADPWWAYALTPCRADALLMGALVALAANARPPAANARRGWVLLAVSWAALVVVVFKSGGPFPHSRAMAAFGYTAVAGLFAAILLLVLGCQPAGWSLLRLRPLRAIGAHSYALYLVHYPIVLFGTVLLATDTARSVLRPLCDAVGSAGPAFAAYFVFVLGASFALARVTWVVIERPFLKLKVRFPMAGPPPERTP